jgi:hypothetical protein
VSVSTFGQVFIIVNSAQVAHDLLSKRSTIYSGRPVLEFGGDLCGWKEMMGFLQNTELLRRYRKWFHQFIGSSAVLQKVLPIVEQETHKFLRRVLLKPQELEVHVRQWVTPLSGATVDDIIFLARLGLSFLRYLMDMM